MCKCVFDECRVKSDDKECKNGKFIYRCGNLNCKNEKIYDDAIEKVLAYDFSKIKVGKRTDWKFYKERTKKEKGAKDVNGTQKACDGCREKITEAFECRCAYLCGSSKCPKDKKWGGTKYEILYYQLPVSQDYDGKIDLVLRKVGTNEIYLTEYKPARTKAPERLLRMICEIVTYRQSSDEGCIDFFNNDDNEQFADISITKENIHTAIMFNESGDDGNSSPQKSEYKNAKEGIRGLLIKHRVSVFELTDDKDIIMLEENV